MHTTKIIILKTELSLTAGFLQSAEKFRGKFPRQFWLMFWGMLISTIGSSMVWPFLMIYLSERLGLPLTAAASLMTINAVSGILSAFVAGPLIDRAGRKWMMVLSLLAYGLVYLLYTQINSYGMAALLMVLSGVINPLYRVAADAMMADLIPPDQRADGYALMRMSSNLGIAIGPAIGGFVAVISYNYAFFLAAAGMSAYAVLMALRARETLPETEAAAGVPAPARARTAAFTLGGYRQVFADRPFLSFIAAFTLTQMCAALIWVLLSVHAKHNYGLPENLYGFIPITNAIMVVALQALVTSRTKRFQPLPVLALGSLFYAVAAASVAFGAGFWAFWTSMVIMTVGELMLMPTSTTYTANLAPTHMRGRYMSIYGLTWGVAQAIGPLTGGFLSDSYGPAAPWLFGGAAGAVAVTAFVVLGMRAASRKTDQAKISAD
jgi:MFS family permease